MADVLDIARIEKELQEINQQRSEVCIQASTVKEAGLALAAAKAAPCHMVLSDPFCAVSASDLQTRERLDAMRGGRGRGRGPPGGVFSRLGGSTMNGGGWQLGLLMAPTKPNSSSVPLSTAMSLRSHVPLSKPCPSAAATAAATISFPVP